MHWVNQVPYMVAPLSLGTSTHTFSSIFGYFGVGSTINISDEVTGGFGTAESALVTSNGCHDYALRPRAESIYYVDYGAFFMNGILQRTNMALPVFEFFIFSPDGRTLIGNRQNGEHVVNLQPTQHETLRSIVPGELLYSFSCYFALTISSR